jgi:intein-encoded DNA endonuclease-like protein
MDKKEKYIIEQYKNGKHKYIIGQELGISEGQVARILKKYKIPTVVARDGNRKLFFYPEEIIRLYKNKNLSTREIGTLYGVGESVIRRVLEFNGIPIKKNGQKVFRDPNFFKEINSEEKAYILGLIFSDGSISENGNISIVQRADRKDIVEAFCQILKTNIHYYETKNQYFSSVQNLDWKKDLARYGIVPRKSTEADSLPLEEIPKSLRHHFLRGLFDGDGLCYFNQGSLVLGFCSNSQNIVEEFFREIDFEEDFTIWKGTVYFSNKSNLKWIEFFYEKVYRDSLFYCAIKREKIEERLRKIPS